MKILVTNDDGLHFDGIHSLVKILRPFGELTVIGPKYHQSGTSMAISMGLKPIAVKKVSELPGERWYYVDGTPATCVKYGIDEIFTDGKPDLVVSGINHGSNASSASLYSGTLGAAKEAALAGIPAIGISLCDMGAHPDFSAVEQMFPDILRKILEHRSDKFGVFYNVNFPLLPAEQIKGVKLATQGTLHWVKEFEPYDYDIFRKYGVTPEDMGLLSFPEREEGEDVFMMVGDMVDDPRNNENTDNELLNNGYVAITVQNIDCTDYEEFNRLKNIF